MPNRMSKKNCIRIGGGLTKEEKEERYNNMSPKEYRHSDTPQLHMTLKRKEEG